ncbi:MULTISPECIES: hypothetical protein [unclassified Burkholderia]|uniref:hypothetical protein n=1 Tax=unclassified Burkholderia TaxID=2613784 RepID=UPI002AB20687|nr:MULTISPECIES: hypothetical protein [unclassified Burkholderia]
MESDASVKKVIAVPPPELPMSAFVPVDTIDAPTPAVAVASPYSEHHYREVALLWASPWARLSARLPNGLVIDLECAELDARHVKTRLFAMRRCSINGRKRLAIQSIRCDQTDYILLTTILLLAAMMLRVEVTYDLVDILSGDHVVSISEYVILGWVVIRNNNSYAWHARSIDLYDDSRYSASVPSDWQRVISPFAGGGAHLKSKCENH